MRHCSRARRMFTGDGRHPTARESMAHLADGALQGAFRAY